jgi:hypothetical protein
VGQKLRGVRSHARGCGRSLSGDITSPLKNMVRGWPAHMSVVTPQGDPRPDLFLDVVRFTRMEREGYRRYDSVMWLCSILRISAHCTVVKTALTSANHLVLDRMLTISSDDRMSTSSVNSRIVNRRSQQSLKLRQNIVQKGRIGPIENQTILALRPWFSLQEIADCHHLDPPKSSRARAGACRLRR